MTGLVAAPAVALVPAALALPAMAAATPAPTVGDDTAIVAAFQRWLDAQNEYERLHQAGADEDTLSDVNEVAIGVMFEALDTPANGVLGLALQVYLSVRVISGTGFDQHASPMVCSRVSATSSLDCATSCYFAGFGRDLRRWRKHSDEALHGFVRCTDGRLYHPFLCAKAVEARKLADDNKARQEAFLQRDRERHARKAGGTDAETEGKAGGTGSEGVGISAPLQDITPQDQDLPPQPPPLGAAPGPRRHQRRPTTAPRGTAGTGGYPAFGDLPVSAVDLPLVLKALEPIWATKTETASRVRGRIEAVLDWATVRGFRQGENPARWRGQLSHLLPARAKVQVVEHHAALPYGEMGAFMVGLRARDAIAARALEFTILTAARTGETIGATWAEVDLDSAIWIVPAGRMKAGREHRVPLSEPAIAILRTMAEHRLGDNLFPSTKGNALSNMAMVMLLRRMDRGDLTAHGFRSSFRDWAAERTAYPNEVLEMALAHTVGNKVEAAYRRGDLFDKRRRLMDDWAAHCAAPPAEHGAAVVPLRRAVG